MKFLVLLASLIAIMLILERGFCVLLYDFWLYIWDKAYFIGQAFVLTEA